MNQKELHAKWVLVLKKREEENGIVLMCIDCMNGHSCKGICDCCLRTQNGDIPA